MSDIKETLTKTFNNVVEMFHDDGVKIGYTGGIIAFAFPTVGAALIVASALELINRNRNGKRVWADPPDNPKKKDESNKPPSPN